MQITRLILTAVTTVAAAFSALAVDSVALYSGEPGVSVFACSPSVPERRIPAITTVNAGPHAGRLITVYDCRWDGGDIGYGNISLQISISDDGGLTWSEPDFARDSSGHPVTDFNRNLTRTDADMWAEIQSDANAAWDCAFGDACIVSDSDTGRLLMMSCAGPLLFWKSRSHNPNQCIRWYSDDGGDTWSAPTRITDDILSLFDGVDPPVDGQFIGSGRLFQSRIVKTSDSYRLYAALSTQSGGKFNPCNWVIYSDDFGLTWSLLGGHDNGRAVPTLADEPKCEELPDGTVLLAARGFRGNRNYNLFTYTDISQGSGTWHTHVNTNLGLVESINACNGDILLVKARNTDTGSVATVALQSLTLSPSRERVGIAWKVVDNATTPDYFGQWDGAICVTSLPSAYSAMCLMADGRIGLFYEEKRSKSVYDGVFLPLTLDQITSGRWK